MIDEERGALEFYAAVVDLFLPERCLEILPEFEIGIFDIDLLLAKSLKNKVLD